MFSEFGEMGEFQCECCLPEEIADVFYEENANADSESDVVLTNGCINLMQYA